MKKYLRYFLLLISALVYSEIAFSADRQDHLFRFSCVKDAEYYVQKTIRDPEREDISSLYDRETNKSKVEKESFEISISVVIEGNGWIDGGSSSTTNFGRSPYTWDRTFTTKASTFSKSSYKWFQFMPPTRNAAYSSLGAPLDKIVLQGTSGSDYAALNKTQITGSLLLRKVESKWKGSFIEEMFNYKHNLIQTTVVHCTCSETKNKSQL